MGVKRILLIYTGGTIGMMSDPATGALKPLDFNEIESEIPALRRLGVEIGYYEGFTPVDSSDITPDIWVDLACVIRDSYSRFDGFVVLHGTDTMSYTASALSFMFEGLAKPVVFTGSQIPIGVLRTDGRENLVTAVEIAASDRVGFDGGRESGRDFGIAAAAGSVPSHIPAVPEVSIYFQNRLFRANRTTKWSAEQLNAFTSENFPPLAEVGVSIHYNSVVPPGRHRPGIATEQPAGHGAVPVGCDGVPLPLVVSTVLCRDVVLVRLFPGMQPHVLASMLSIPGLRGVVLQTYGAGNTPTAPWFFDIIEGAISRGIVIVNVSQCPAGGVRPIYESGVRLAASGVISGGDMTPEAALAKLMYVLGLSLPPAATRAALASSLRGELSM